IDDVELRGEVLKLRPGDCVRVTAVVGTRAFPGHCLLVRITSVRGNVFRGRLARTPASACLAQLKGGSLLTFTAGHIHSVASKRPAAPAGPGGARPEPAAAAPGCRARGARRASVRGGGGV